MKHYRVASLIAALSKFASSIARPQVPIVCKIKTMNRNIQQGHYETQSGSGFSSRQFTLLERERILSFRLLSVLVAFLIFTGALAAQTDDLLTRVWNGVQQAQKRYASSCGTITETRSSSLMVKPLVLRGKFCAEGTTRFALDYFEPSAMRVRFNEKYVNVTSDGKTEAMDIGKNVRRTQSYFGRENSLGNLKKSFTVTVEEDGGDYQMKLVPRSDIFRRRLNYLVIKLDKRDFLLRSLEVDGKSGVHSVFVIDVSSMNPKIPPEMFEVSKPQ